MDRHLYIDGAVRHDLNWRKQERKKGRKDRKYTTDLCQVFISGVLNVAISQARKNFHLFKKVSKLFQALYL